jgi:hypothetical protein
MFRAVEPYAVVQWSVLVTRTDEVAGSNGCLKASYMITENLRVLPQFLLFIDSTL